MVYCQLNIPTMTPNTSRVYGLDILRALAILFVLVGHAMPIVREDGPYPFGFSPIFDGVMIFFVLSGYLIGSILIKVLEREGATFKAISGFWMRRWLRTLPNYFFVLTVIVILHAATFPEVWKFYLFSQNVYTSHPSFFPEAWSLSVEEWFYLLTPLLLIGSSKVFGIRPKHAVISTIAFVVVFSLLYRFYLFVSNDVTGWDDYSKIFRTRVFTRMDSLIFGVLAAFLNFYYKKRWLNNKEILFACGIILLIIDKALITSIDGNHYHNAPQLFDCVFLFMIGSLGVMLTIPLLSTIKEGRGLIFKFVTFISLISYSLYLVHHTVVQFYLVPIFNRYVSLRLPELQVKILTYGCYWGLSLGIAYGLYRLIELPFMNLRDRYFK